MPKEILVKSVLNKNKKRDNWFLNDYTLNMYSSCSFNCAYCYIRGSKYGINLEESLSVKTNGLEILEKELSSKEKKNNYGIIVVSSATDPYLPIEKSYMLNREALKIILKYKFPVHIITKSDLVERDFDLLEEIDRTAILPPELKRFLNHGALISFSFSTLSERTAKIFEPGAPSISKRLEILKKTISGGFYSGVSLMPLIPHVSDTEEELDFAFSTFSKIGVNYLLPASMTLYGSGYSDSRILVLYIIKNHFPELESKYLNYFGFSDQMPSSYIRELNKKFSDLFKKYKIKSSILTF